MGTYGSAGPNLIDTCVTQTFGTLIVTASTAAVGQLREARAAYITRCQLSPDGNAPGGPQKAFLRAMNTAGDGTVLQRYDGSGPVNIASAQVSPSSSTGVVTMYVAGIAGAVDSIDVSSANLNILGLSQGVITAPTTAAPTTIAPIGVLPDTATIGPTTSDPNILPTGTPGCASATNQAVAVTYSVKVRSSQVPGGATPGTYTSGGAPPAPIAALFTSIATALGVALPALGIGGLDQVALAGSVYPGDIQDTIKDANPGQYNAVVSVPSAAVTVPAGYIPVAGTITGTIFVVAG